MNPITKPPIRLPTPIAVSRKPYAVSPLTAWPWTMFSA
jgi:hypothetical protein